MAIPDPTWDPTDFQATLNAFLDRQEWSQNRLATELGISQTAVNRWFQPYDKEGPGRVTRPRPEVLAQLARVMGYPLVELQRLCGYPVESSARVERDAALNSLTNLIEAAYEATEDPARRQIGIDAISAVVQSLWSSHRRGRTRRPRDRKPDVEGPIIVPRVSYA